MVEVFRVHQDLLHWEKGQITNNEERQIYKDYCDMRAGVLDSAIMAICVPAGVSTPSGTKILCNTPVA